jgi:hypothetical protein
MVLYRKIGINTLFAFIIIECKKNEKFKIYVSTIISSLRDSFIKFQYKNLRKINYFFNPAGSPAEGRGEIIVG